MFCFQLIFDLSLNIFILRVNKSFRTLKSNVIELQIA